MDDQRATSAGAKAVAVRRHSERRSPLSVGRGKTLFRGIERSIDSVRQKLNQAELIIIHRWIKTIQKCDGITYDQACKRLYAEQNERLLCADEDAKAFRDSSTN